MVKIRKNFKRKTYLAENVEAILGSGEHGLFTPTQRTLVITRSLHLSLHPKTSLTKKVGTVQHHHLYKKYKILANGAKLFIRIHGATLRVSSGMKDSKLAPKELSVSGDFVFYGQKNPDFLIIWIERLDDGIGLHVGSMTKMHKEMLL